MSERPGRQPRENSTPQGAPPAGETFQGTFGEFIGNTLGGIGMVANPFAGLISLVVQDMLGQGLSGTRGPRGVGQMAMSALRPQTDPFTGLPTGGGGGGDDRGPHAGTTNLGRSGYTSGIVDNRSGRMVGGV